jgi:ADP-heptose:LPS heptosyltransferase
MPLCTENHAHVLKGNDVFAVEQPAATLLRLLPATPVSLRRRLSRMHLARADIDAAIEDLLQAGFMEKGSLLRYAWSQAAGLRRHARLASLRALYQRGALALFVLRCHYLRRKLDGQESHGAESAESGPLQKILVIAYGGIGDMVLTTPVLRRLHDAYPTAAIDVLVRGKNAAVYGRCPLIRRVIPFAGVREMFRCRGGPSELARELYRTHYDVVVCVMEHFGGTYRWLTGKAIAYLTGATIRIGTWDGMCQLAGGLARPFLTHPVAHRREHEVRRGVRLVSQLGVDGPPGCLEVWCGPHERRQATRIIARCQASQGGATVIGIAPFTAREKMWPLDYWAQLLTRLAGDVDYTGLIFGGAGNVKPAAVLNTLCQNRLVNLAGQTPLPLFCALVGQLNLLLSVDTGAAHIRAAYRRPQVVLFGPVNPGRYGPWRNPYARLLRAPGGWMQNLAVEDVYYAVRQLEI